MINLTTDMTKSDLEAARSPLVPGGPFEDLNRADALIRAEAGAARARRAGLDAEPLATIAPTTWQGIVDVADDLDVSVIVIASRGRSDLRELARGSLSHDVATHTRQPVLIVPPSRGAA
jgi:nucleotide-binding universal stress UspA family protein